MKALAPAALAVLLATSAAAQTPIVVQRGTIAIYAPISGVVVPAEETVITAKKDGRIEALPVASLTPFKKHALLALESSPDLAAIIDANATTPEEVVEQRWQSLYKPMKVRAPFDGFLLDTKVGLKEMVKAGEPLFTVTRELVFQASVPLQDTTGMASGKTAWLWRPSNPELKMAARVLQILPGNPTPDQAQVRIELLPAPDIAAPLPGTLLDGEVSVAEHRDVVTVPSAAIRRSQGRSFVYVQVSEGLTDGTNTEITSGLKPGDVILAP